MPLEKRNGRNTTIRFVLDLSFATEEKFSSRIRKKLLINPLATFHFVVRISVSALYPAVQAHYPT